jgi:ABC-type transport system substrate-binding protein
VRVLEQPGELLWALVPNLKGAPWGSLAHRQALLAAIDRSALVARMAPAPARVAWGWLPSAPYPLQVPAGTSLAGVHVRLNVGPRSAGGTNALLAEQLVADLGKAGLTVEVVEQKELFQAVVRGDFEGLALVSRDTGDPGRFMNAPWVNGRVQLDRAAGDHFDDEMVERYDAWASCLYAERKAFLASAMQEAWFKRLPVLPLVLTSRLAAVRADLLGPEWGAADSLWWNLNDWRFEEPRR